MSLKVSIDGVEYELHATFKAYCAIEKALGQKYSNIIMNFSTGQVGLLDVAQILCIAINVNEEKVNLDKIGAALIQTGYLTFSEVIINYLSIGLLGPENAQKNISAKKNMNH